MPRYQREIVILEDVVWAEVDLGLAEVNELLQLVFDPAPRLVVFPTEVDHVGRAPDGSFAGKELACFPNR
ncbi:MAG TPA: hypothetical protein VFJ58_28110 [Armatimonadota bacterium]|nr:hypothetical protein [Armatimonadota bacterium]